VTSAGTFTSNAGFAGVPARGLTIMVTPDPHRLGVRASTRHNTRETAGAVAASPLHGILDLLDRLPGLAAHLTHGFLDVPQRLVALALGLQVVVAQQAADRLLDLAFRPLNLAVTFVLATTSERP